METVKKIMIALMKDAAQTHTVTSLAKALSISRVGIWKALKRLEEKNYIKVEATGTGRTSTTIVTINWNNPPVEKALALYLTEEAIQQRRWIVNFKEIEKNVEFLILYGSILTDAKHANDIDVIVIARRNKFVRIQEINDAIQKTEDKRIHLISFTRSEFKEELKRKNRAYIDAVRHGVILFGQEEFVRCIKDG